MNYDSLREAMSARPYENSRAKDTLARMNSSTGLLVYGPTKRILEEMGFPLDDQKDNKSVYNKEDLYLALQRYADYDVEPDFKPELYDLAHQVTLKAFTFRNAGDGDIQEEIQLAPLRYKEQIFMALKGEKASGAPEFQHKKDVMDKDYARMLRWAYEGQAAQPCTAQYRIQHGVEGPKTRLVWAYPQSITMAEAMFARPLINEYLKRNTPMLIGRRRFHVAARMTSIENSHAQYGLDMSKFDASCSRSLIKMAFGILRHNLHLTAVEEKIYHEVMQYFIYTPILMPDGYTYKKRRGVPSGSYFTQMVDSIINYFIIQYVWLSLTNTTIRKQRIFVLGDDSLFGANQAFKLKVVAQEFAKIGFTVHQDAKSYTAIDNNRPVEMMQHLWDHGVVDRDQRDIAVRMCYPERYTKTDNVKELIITRMYQYSADSLSAHQILYEFSNFKGPDISSVYRVNINPEYLNYGWKENLESSDVETDLKSAINLAYKGVYI